MNKYTYYKVLQSNHGYGWDDVEFFNLADSTVNAANNIFNISGYLN